MQYSFSTVLFQASFIVKIQVVLAHRVRELCFATNFLFIFTFRPQVQFHCDLLYDPFLFMERRNKIYCMLFSSLSPSPKSEILIAFTITIREWSATIPTLWKHVMGPFFFLLKDRRHVNILFQISFMTIQNTSPKTIH